MLPSTDLARQIRAGTTVTLANGRAGTVRTARRRHAADRILGVDARSPTHETSCSRGPCPPAPPPRPAAARPVSPAPPTTPAAMPKPSPAPPPAPAGTAAYLRCYPFDPWGMRAHQHALADYAQYLKLPTPVLYLDNGRRGQCPEFDRLLRALTTGRHTTVLVPGPWVLHLDPDTAEQRLRLLTGSGCRVIELPRPPW
ncbi:hypothetical protein [Kitasatospora sp. NPDC088346]|uniref:hypothetical protein n=1 Tax=Kitasatospora sp. NPDC088346 TaxID=3364073 RepID=UPI0038001908